MIRDGLPWIDTETPIVLASDEAREQEEADTDVRLADLLAGWHAGEITTLIRVLEVLREGHRRTAHRYRSLSCVPRPSVVQGQIDYDDASVRCLDHAIGSLLVCRRTRRA